MILHVVTRIAPWLLLLSAGLALAAQSPGQKCETGKNQEAGKYAACLHKAEAKLLKTKGACSVSSGTACYGDEDCPALETCSKDLTKYGIAVQKCEDKFEAKWDKLTQTAIDKSDACPDGLQQSDVKLVLDACVANVAGGLAGEGLGSCPADLAACQAAPQAQRLQTGQTNCWDGSGTPISCGGSGQDGDLQKGVAVSHVDNGDGTISDNHTGLMWERLNDGGGLNDKDATFSWANAFNKVRVLNGDATGCIAAGNPSSCCTGAGTGSGCDAFAGYTDWRLPNVNELHSLVNYGASSPAAHPAFHAGCVANCTTCSCTQSSFYWSSTALQNLPTIAWMVNLGGGLVLDSAKTDSRSVRAVRGGS